MTDIPLDDHLVAELTIRYRERLSDGQIETVVKDVWRAVNQQARFENYVTVLARRIADERLRLLARARGGDERE